ncbi:ATP-binding protein [Vibrio profundi]|uniref:ATP-binding protein n=1 Tax=Vibrio profundi TaxID=1774960 RepID=UPI003735F8D8
MMIRYVISVLGWLTIGLSVIFSSFTLADTSNAFSSEELRWMERNQVLTVVVRRDKYPYMFVNNRGDVDGIIAQYMDEIASITGLDIEYVFASNALEAKGMLNNGEADVFPISFPVNIGEQKATYSTPYLPYQRQLITKVDAAKIYQATQLRTLTIGVVLGAEMTAWFETRYANIGTKVYANEQDAIRAVSEGKVFGIIAELVSIMDLAKKLGVENIKPNSQIQGWEHSEARLAITPNLPILKSILDKAINRVSFQAQNSIMSSWLAGNPYRIKLDGAFDYGNPPYMYAESAAIGLEYSFLQKVFNNMGYQIGDVYRAPISSREDVLKRDANLDFNSGITNKAEGERNYSVPALELEYIAVSIRARELNLSDFTSIDSLRVGSIIQDGASPSRKAFSAFIAKIKPRHTADFQSLKEAFEALANNTVDAVIVEKRVLDWYLEHESELDRSAIQIHRDFSESYPVFLEWRDPKLRDKFNASLESLYEDKQAMRKFVNSHIESDFRPQMQRADIIAQIAAYYLYSDNLEGLNSALEIYDLSQDIAAIEIYDEKKDQKVYSVVTTEQGLKFAREFDRSHYMSVTKDSIYLSETGAIKVGVMIFYFDYKVSESDYAYLPSLSFFSNFSDKEFSYISKIYEENNLTGQILNLTPDELRWIKNNPIQKIAVDPQTLPYEAFNAEGEYIGMISEFLQIIETKTGLKFEPQLVESWEETEKLIQNRTVPLLSAARENETFLADYQAGLRLFSSALAVASKSEVSGMLISDLNQWKVGILNGAANTQKLMSKYPNVEWVMIDNTKQGLKLVENNKLDAMLDTVHVLNFLINTQAYRDIRIIGRSDYLVSPTIHTSRNEPILYSILGKAIKAIPQKEKNGIISKWTAPKFIDKTNYELVYTVVVIAVLVLLTSIIWNRRLKAEVNRTKQARAAAEQLQEQMFGVLNASPIAAVIVQNEKVIYTNERALELFAIRRESVKDLDVTAIYPEVSVREEIYQALVVNRNVVNKELNLRKLDGTAFTALTSYYLINYQDSIATLFWAYDISEQKALNIQLKEAMLDADSANQAKSDFLANMSHEIRTPMNAILGMSYLALQEEQSKPAENYVKKVHRSAESLLNIINDILDFSKIEAGKLNIESAPFKLSVLLEELEDIVLIKALEKSLTLNLSTDPDVPNGIVGDSVRVYQVLLNLLGNAVKFTQAGSVSLHVSLVEQFDDQVRLRFNVCDTGIGISVEQQDNLFEAFSQADASTTRKYGGTGLGLNISQKLVSAMNGHINVASEVGQGSCFTVDLSFPLAEESFNQVDYTLRSVVDLDLAQARILLVEDNVTNQELALAFLDKFNTVVDVANQGEEAIERVKAQDYDAILMDLQMPVMDGFEATKQIRNINLKVPIIAMSANVIGDVKKKANDSGMNDFVEKPVIINRLAAALGRWVNGESVPVSEADDIRSYAENDESNDVFNVALGLTYCNHDKSLLEKLMKRFNNQIDDIIPQYRQLIEQGEPQELERLSHTLKSTSGAIGASQTSQLFSELETYFGDVAEQGNAEPELQKLSEALWALRKQFNEYWDKQELRGKQNSEDVSDTKSTNSVSISIEGFARLESLLENYDVEALEVLQSLIEQHPDNRKQLEPISALIEDYEFESALDHLKRIQQ